MVDDERRPLLVTRRIEADDALVPALSYGGCNTGSCHTGNAPLRVRENMEDESIDSGASRRKNVQGGTTWRATTTVLLLSTMILWFHFCDPSSIPLGMGHVPFPGINTVLLGAIRNDGTTAAATTTPKSKKGGKVVVVQVIKIQFPQQPTGPYGYPYYYPPPPGYYNNYAPPPPPDETQQQQQQQQPPPQQPVITTEKPTEQEWKKYQDKYITSKDETKDNNRSRKQDETSQKPADAAADDTPPSSSPSVSSSSEQNEVDAMPTTANRRAATAPYNWQQWTQGTNSGSSSGGGGSGGSDSSNSGTGTYDWQKWTTNSKASTTDSTTSDSKEGSSYDWHQWADKFKVAAPSTEPSNSPTQIPSSRPTVSSPIHLPSTNNNPGTTGPFNIQTNPPTERSTILPTPPPSVHDTSHSSIPTSGPASPSPSGVLIGGRLLEETFTIDVNVSCESAFLEPVFHDFIEEQRVAHTLADNVGLDDARLIAAHLYEELGHNGTDGHTVIMYVDYDDDARTADMVLVHGFDIFDNYREHYEFIPVPTTTPSKAGKRRTAGIGTPHPRCRIVRTLSATLTRPDSLGSNSASQWLSDHNGDMQAFKKYVESRGEPPSTVASTIPTRDPMSPKRIRKTDGATPLTHIPTPEPISLTDAPILIPTTVPTVVPIAATIAPTVSATLSPTAAPTVLPTVSPTDDPTTDAPTVTPTGTPTDAPTVTPTDAPTPSPTSTPTASPTFTHTYAPTLALTADPTVTPTAQTAAPTSTPTIAPVSPTSVPVAPTKLPRRKRTPVAPTLEPSADSSIHSKRKHTEAVNHF